jgi:hypothetical protein
MTDHRTLDQVLAEIDAVLPPETPEEAQERRKRVELTRRRRYVQERSGES